MAVASMYNGFHFLSLNPSTNSLEITGEFRKHTSIAYGVDWNKQTGHLGTCSFYDHQFYLSSIDSHHPHSDQN